MRQVSFDEYIQNRHKYKHGDIIPMSEEDIWRVAKVVDAMDNSKTVGKDVYNFVEIGNKETSLPIRAIIIMQTVTLLCVVFILAFI